MTDYSSLKVPELKKLLTDRKLPITGNKPDLVARLQEDDSNSAAPAADAKPGKLPLSGNLHPSSRANTVHELTNL